MPENAVRNYADVPLDKLAAAETECDGYPGQESMRARDRLRRWRKGFAFATRKTSSNALAKRCLNLFLRARSVVFSRRLILGRPAGTHVSLSTAIEPYHAEHVVPGPSIVRGRQKLPFPDVTFKLASGVNRPGDALAVSAALRWPSAFGLQASRLHFWSTLSAVAAAGNTSYKTLENTHPVH